jgi:hypothetical protein
MNTIKKTTLIAVITAMAAFAVPSMASAAAWVRGPNGNPNKTLTRTSPVVYASNYLSVSCADSTLGAFTFNPSPTLSITSASFTNCTAYFSSGQPCGAATVTATGLPWAAVSSGAPNVTMTEHLQVTLLCTLGSPTYNIDGPVTGTYTNATHTLSVHPTSPMALTFSGTWLANILTGSTHAWHETTDTLTLI